MSEHEISANGHASVLLAEAVEALSVRPEGRYLDATFGRGGHAAAILAQLGPAGRLYAIDQDPTAVAVARSRFADEPRFAIWHGSFARLDQALAGWDVTTVDGILMDLGVSSPQLDDAERGFSFQQDGPLDMRMNPSAGEPACDWLNRAEVDEIARVLKDYGEERQARRIARAIVRRREETPFQRTGELAECIAAVIGRREPGKHPATRSFQAIRIHINGELDDIDVGLERAVAALAPGGRLVVISFHSLEDRRVKRFIRRESSPPPADRRLPPTEPEQALRLRKLGSAIRPGAAECQTNPRARSAIMRVAERS